jgi:L-seryl-tRNA(Ser) seleniumtransferase
MSRAERFRELPAVDRLVAHPDLSKELAEHGPARLADLARAAVAELRERLAADELAADRDGLISLALAGVRRRLETARRKRLTRVVNATGVVLHTNLGRAPLADEALQAIADVGRYGNVELDLETGDRSRRGGQLDELWRELTGAEASLVVNNCAAATLLTLQTLASGKEALVSRGQLIEIGGSYRLPDVFRQSGALLREVGTTNRTRLADYESAILPGTTAALLRVHPSNFRVVGFVEEVSISELVQLAERRDLFALDDVGSGALVDLAPYG